MNNTDTIDAAKEEISVKRIIGTIKHAINYLLAEWKLILVISFFGGVIGVVAAYFDKTKYTATLSYVMETGGSSKSAGLGSLASQFGFNVGSGGEGMFDGNTLMDLFKSRSILERVLLQEMTVNGKKTTLAEFYIDFNQLRVKKWYETSAYPPQLLFPVNSDPAKFNLVQSGVMGAVAQRIASQNINIRQKEKNSNIYLISIKSENEIFSKLLIDLLIKEVSEFYTETKTQKAKQNVILLQKQTDSVRGELNQAIGAVASANDNTYNLNQALNIKRVPSARRQVDVQANTSILSQLVQNLELAKLTLMQETPLIQVIDAPVLPLQAERMGKIPSFIRGGFIAFFLTVFVLLISAWWKKQAAE